MENAIVVKNLGKAYHIFDKVSDRFWQNFRRKPLYREFWALRDVSFTVPKGQVYGIVGRNGSGKSTLLQMIAGTLKPTVGSIECNGKVAALLELGSGFNMEFTGRENVYLSGNLYGISEKEMDRRFAEIERFADIGEFMDRPVKTYSSGMFARLAFAVNINVSADIVIIDEVLSVGDHFFQAKCMSAIDRMIRSGTTVLIVSHTQATVKALCSKAILLQSGQLEMLGDCDEVMDRYMALSLSEDAYGEPAEDGRNERTRDAQVVSTAQPPFEKRITERFGDGRVQYIETVLYQNGTECAVLNAHQSCRLSTFLRANEDIDTTMELGVVIRTFEGIELFAMNNFFAGKTIPPMKKGDVLRVDYDFPVKLGAGKYSVALGCRAPVQGEYADKVFNAAIFDVVNLSAHPIPLLFDMPYEMTVTGGEQ